MDDLSHPDMKRLGSTSWGAWRACFGACRGLQYRLIVREKVQLPKRKRRKQNMDVIRGKNDEREKQERDLERGRRIEREKERNRKK